MERRHDTGRIAGVHARLLDVLHDPGGHHAPRRRQSRRRRPRTHLPGTGRAGPNAPARPPVARGHRLGSVSLVVGHEHRTPAEHVGGTDQHRVADTLGDLLASSERCAPCPTPAPDIELRSRLPKRSRSSARSIESGRGAQDLDACGLGAPAPDFSGVCPPNCTITPVRLLDVGDVQHVLEVNGSK